MAKKLLIVAMLLAVAGGVVTLVCAARQRSAAVDAGKLPATASVLGTTVTLKSFDGRGCCPGTLRLVFQHPLPDREHPEIRPGNTTIKWNGGSRVEQTGETRNGGSGGMTEDGVFCNLPSNVRSVTVVQEYYRPGQGSKGVDFIFDNIPLSGLPVTRRCGKAEMTMVSAAIRKSIRPEETLGSENAHVRPGESFLLIKFVAKYPDGFMRDWDSTPMCSSGDKELPHMGNWDDNQGEDYPPEPGIPVRKPSGKLVTVHEYWAFEAQSMPSHISFDPVILLPPDPKDTAKVTFKNVPVP